MRCLKSSEIRKWLAGQGIHHQPVVAGVPVAGEYPLPPGRSCRLQLAEDLTGLMRKDGTKLIEILPGPGSRAGDYERLHRLRANLAEGRPLETAPGHLFRSRERDEFGEMLSVLFSFGSGWQLYVYGAPSRTTLLVSDRIEMWSVKKGGLRNQLRKRLDLGLAA